MANKDWTKWILNVALPGAGLIIARREWLGLSLALLFGLCGQVLIAGWMIAPLAVPGWLSTLAGGLTLMVWAAAQVLMARQQVVDRRVVAGVLAMLRDGGRAIDRGDLEAARVAAEGALALDDEDAAVHALFGRLREELGDVGSARRAWRRVLRLHPSPDLRDEAAEALDRLNEQQRSAALPEGSR